MLTIHAKDDADLGRHIVEIAQTVKNGETIRVNLVMSDWSGLRDISRNHNGVVSVRPVVWN